MKIERRGKEISLTFDKSDPIARELLRNIADTLRAHGRNREYEQVKALEQQPPEIDPGG